MLAGGSKRENKRENGRMPEKRHEKTYFKLLQRICVRVRENNLIPNLLCETSVTQHDVMMYD